MDKTVKLMYVNTLLVRDDDSEAKDADQEKNAEVENVYQFARTYLRF